LADNVVAFCDQIRSPPEVQVRESGAEIGHEGLDVFTAAAGLVERILQQHVRGRDLINHRKIYLLTPELREPAADHGLVVFFFAHLDASFCRY
jgi:hypothetical protein